MLKLHVQDSVVLCLSTSTLKFSGHAGWLFLLAQSQACAGQLEARLQVLSQGA